MTQENLVRKWINIMLSASVLGMLFTCLIYSDVTHSAYEYQYTEEEINWEWAGCHFDVSVPYPCGTSGDWWNPTSWSIEWCTASVSFPYPCYVTNTATHTGQACRGSGGRVAELLTKLPSAGSKLPDVSTPVADPLTASGDTLYSIYRKGLITRHVTKNGRVLAEVALEKVSCLKLTNSSFVKLQLDGFPANDLNSLKTSLQDQQFCTATAFLDAVKTQIGYQQTDIYELIFKSAEKIGFVPEDYDKSGSIDIRHSDGTVIKIPIGNVRYSEELTLPAASTTTERIMWAPVIAPIKNPGYSNNGYYVVSGNDDNALYYSGGLALATFSLEAMHDVSPHSLDYARRIILYFLASEMWEGNGYILRKPGFFNSNRNRNGESIIQGASPEEILGLFLGISYYLKAENPTHLLYKEATRLRDDVLRQVTKGDYFWDKYEHPFMNSSDDPSYPIKYLEFPLVATKEYAPGKDYIPGIFESAEQYYISTLTLGSGDTRPAGHWYTFGRKASFQDYMMFLTSMILVLDGNIPEDKKEWFAEVYMRDVIKASKTAGPDIDSLWDNQYMAVVALLVNKYLNSARDSSALSEKLHSIWGPLDGYRRMVSTAALPMPTPVGRTWQHNLPLSKVTNAAREDDGTPKYGWKDHNPNNGIGRQFVWRYENIQELDKSFTWLSSEYDWRTDFPAWTEKYGTSMFSPGDQGTDSSYKSSREKGYIWDKYLKQEIINYRGSNDNQVEGAGLGLLFLRMLLTHIDPVKFPPPDIPDKDTLYPVLPYVGAEPMSPQWMHNAYRYSSKVDDACGPFEIKGDQDNALRITKVGSGNAAGAKDFIVSYANNNEELELKHGFVADGSTPGIGRGVYIDSKGTTWNRFDKASLTTTVNSSGENLLIMAERAEGDISINPLSGCFLQRVHWLRMTLWWIPSFANESDPNPFQLAAWDSDGRHCDGAGEIDMTLVDNNHVAVIYRTRHNKDRVRVFKIEDNQLSPVYNELITDENYDDNIHITSAYNNLVIYTKQYSSGWRLKSARWNGNNLEHKSISSIQYNELLDMTTVESNGKYYVLIAVKNEGYLKASSYELMPDGALTYKGDFDTKYGTSYLVGKEADYERASITDFKLDNKAGFVIVGKGVAREIKDSEGDWKKTDKGLKIVYGRLINEKPSIETSNVLGSGESSAMSMLDVSGHISDGGFHGVLSAHKTKTQDCFLGLFWCEQYLGLTFWQYRDAYQDQRW